MVSSSTLLLVLSTFASTISAQCFWPAGNAASGMVPCGGSSSTCCSDTSMCLSNGLCRISSDPAATQYARGACTDANWGPGCLQQCQKQSTPGSLITNTAAIFLCSGDGPSDPAGASYCCEQYIGQKTGCCSSGATFSLPAGAPPAAAASSSAPPPSSKKAAGGVFLQQASSSSAAAATKSSSTSCTSTYSASSLLASGNSTSYPTGSHGPSQTSNGTITSTAGPTAISPAPTGGAARIGSVGGVLLFVGMGVVLTL